MFSPECFEHETKRVRAVHGNHAAPSTNAFLWDKRRPTVSTMARARLGNTCPRRVIFYRFSPPHHGRADPKFPLLHSIGGNNNYNSYCIHAYVHTYKISTYTIRAYVGGTILQRFSTGWYGRTIYADVLEKNKMFTI